MQSKVVLLYYKYQPVDDLSAVIKSQKLLCVENNLMGRIRVANEGINGTISGFLSDVESYIQQTSKTFNNVDWKISPASSQADECFDGLIVKEFASIVGNNSDVTYCPKITGIHLSPEEFHYKLAQSMIFNDPPGQAKLNDDTVLIDVRNKYEYMIGRFKGATNPETRTFREFDKWIETARTDGLFEGKKNIMMYCTGGIRCEKASIQLKKKLGLLDENKDLNGIQVFQLKGGIHRYLEKFSHNGSLFDGKNFVFDKRVVQATDSTCACEAETNELKTDDIIGECLYCARKFDTCHDDRRCQKCRLLLLICDDCQIKTGGKYFCSEHAYLNDPGLVQDKLKELKAYLTSEQLIGRRQRCKRVNVKKQIAYLQDILQNLSITF